MIAASFDDKVFLPTKMAATVDVLSREGIAPSDVLRGTHVVAEQVNSPSVRISLNQLLECYRNAVRLSCNPLLGYCIGSTIHLSAYGMYGFAMLCSTSARGSMEFAVKYHPLASPLTSIAFAERGRSAIWTVEPLLHPRIDSRMYAFLTELQVGIHVSLHRDTMGETFVPREIALSYRPTSSADLGSLIGCPVHYQKQSNQLIYDSSWLDVPPKLGNRTTYASLIPLCDQLMNDLAQRCGIAGKVRSIILQDIANHPNFTTTARLLQLTPRTLRRQLRQQNTSFQELLDEVRAHIGTKYLRDTAMTTEDIAFALGFSDAANFRHAFRRWMKTTPREYRTVDNGFKEIGLTVHPVGESISG
jgi:AraC-like DNA-binding protein